VIKGREKGSTPHRERHPRGVTRSDVAAVWFRAITGERAKPVAVGGNGLGRRLKQRRGS